MERATILITSVGTLIGQVILDSLEHRRSRLRVIGCNRTAETANTFRCDRAWLTPPTDQAGAFTDAFMQIFERERPDLVIPGRDPDILSLTRLAERQPQLHSVLLAGSHTMAHMMDDKAETHRFSVRHGLRFADSVETNGPGTIEAARALRDRHGFPLIAKPSNGSGSVGVRILLNDAHLDAASGRPSLVIQPFLDPPAELSFSVDEGWPLFWGIVEDRIHGAQILISRDGTIGPMLGFRACMVAGRCERLMRCDDSALLDSAHAFARAASAEGWRGPFNVQAKRDRNGDWRIIELNGRFSGGTAARRHLGLDEVALMINEWLGSEVVPLDTSPQARVVIMQPVERPLYTDRINTLTNDGQWTFS
jgi:carbamoyl-phosphate synthase large subunit